MRNKRLYIVVILFVALAFSSACKKRVSALPPSPPPTPLPVSVSLTVEPSNIQPGETATLRWESQNADEVNLSPDPRLLEAQGFLSVSPSESITYTLVARGPGGTAEATARLTVMDRPAASQPTPDDSRAASLAEMFRSGMRPAFFDYDKAEIRSDGREALTFSATFLRDNPHVRINIEGHCDERGSTAYNLGLGDRRANAAKEFLVSIGISADRISTISYGQEKPFCMDQTESCWQENRRAHFVCTNCEEFSSRNAMAQ